MQPSPDGLAQAFVIASDFLIDSLSALILGDNLFYGEDFRKHLHVANDRRDGATIFGYHVADPSAYGVVEFRSDRRVLSLEEKPKHPKSNYAIPGLYLYDNRVVDYARSLKPSALGEREITDLHQIYLAHEALEVELLGRRTAWLDTGTHLSLLEAAEYIHVMETRQGLKIACLEEIAGVRGGWIQALLSVRPIDIESPLTVPTVFTLMQP